MSSGHWSWRTTANASVLLGFLVGVSYVLFAHKATVVGHALVASPARWGPVLGLGATVCAGAVWRRTRRRRLEQAQSRDPTETEPRQELDDQPAEH